MSTTAPSGRGIGVLTTPERNDHGNARFCGGAQVRVMSLPIDVIRIVDAKAQALRIPSANLAAIVHVESAGKVYATVDGEQRPMILFEPHLFYRKLTGAARDEAVSLKLASAKWNKKLYPGSQGGRWRQIEAAQALCHRHGLSDVLAFESASYGVGQVLGEHWDDLGFASFNDFYSLMMSGAAGQIEIMCRYIVHNGLLDELQEGRWPAFFRGYNGPAWKRNGYDKAIEAALPLYGASAAPADGMLRLGAKGARVRELQALLVRAGHELKVDGDFGPATKGAVEAFQTANALRVDGVAGPATLKALSTFRQGAGDRPGQQKPVDIDEVKQGAGGIGGGIALETLQSKVDDATAGLQQVAGFEPWVSYGLAVLSLAALALAAWGAWRMISGWLDSRKTVEV